MLIVFTRSILIYLFLLIVMRLMGTLIDSIISCTVISSLLIASKSIPSGVITITGLPLMIRLGRNIQRCNLDEDKVQSLIDKLGYKQDEILLLLIGTCVSDIGIQASSAAINVMVNSKGCNSPNCFLPINRITINKNK